MFGTLAVCVCVAVLGLYCGTQASLAVACGLSSCSMDLVAHPILIVPSPPNIMRE